ncbi:MAG: YHS domain-containing protein [Actinobacteria bacterium]|nr:YHS domain-containing protein [Actinomycetota bacterium]
MENIVECPVCGMTFPQSQAGATATDDAQTYYFCSTSCRDAFVANPGRYVGNTGS